MNKHNLLSIIDDLNYDVFTDICNDITKIDRGEIDNELSRQANIFAHYAVLQDICKKRLDDANLDMTIFMGSSRKEGQDDLSGRAKKPTAKDLDDHVVSQPKYRELGQKVNELSMKYQMLRSLVGALAQKKDVMVQISANLRAEKNIYS
tara:strand:- start:873 stop:1319 length:447 start_codon:yes stop_codon:yes gene_type:complete